MKKVKKREKNNMKKINSFTGFIGNEYYIDGNVTIPCCNNMNPNLYGYIISRFFKHRMCLNCGASHNDFGLIKLGIFILVLKNFPSENIPFIIIKNKEETDIQHKWKLSFLKETETLIVNEEKNYLKFVFFSYWSILKYFLKKVFKIK